MVCKLAKWRHGSWRYQPVIRTVDAGTAITLCECYFDADGKLEAWTENPAIQPQGETIEELFADILYMMADAYCWVAVPFDSLQVGMTFQQLVDADVHQMMSSMNISEIMRYRNID